MEHLGLIRCAYVQESSGSIDSSSPSWSSSTRFRATESPTGNDKAAPRLPSNQGWQQRFGFGEHLLLDLMTPLLDNRRSRETMETNAS